MHDPHALRAALADAQSVTLTTLAAIAARRRATLAGTDPRGAAWPDDVKPAIAEARDAGCTWARIAAALGIAEPATIALARRVRAKPAQPLRDPTTAPLAYTPTAEDDARVRAQYLGADPPSPT